MITKKLLLISSIVLIAAASFAEITPATTVAAKPVAAEPAFPYVAQATGSNVYVRAGAGTAYFYCTQISKPATVIVVGKKYKDWCEVVPPKDCFSWVSTDYVTPDSTNAGIGIVTGDNVLVYAGADYINPKHSPAPQTKATLNKGDQVKLLGEEKNNYYKIAPPPGAHLYINNRFLKYVGPVETKPFTPKDIEKKPEPTPEKKPTVKPDKKVPAKGLAMSKIEVALPVKPVVPVKPKQTTEETKRILQCRDLIKKIEAEIKKPADKQNYAEIRKTLEEIEKDPKAGKAKKYAQYQLAIVSRFELAVDAGKQLKLQQEELDKARSRIKQKTAKKQVDVPQEGNYTISGTIKKSHVYTSKAGQVRYLIVNDAGKIIAYAVAAPTAEGISSTMMGKKVGVNGKMIENKDNTTTLIEFTEIVELTN